MPADASAIIDKAADAASASVAETERTLIDLAKKTEKAIQDGLAELRLRSRDYADVAGEQFDTAQKYVVDRVQERPMAATLVALGIGVVLGVMLTGGRRR